MMPGILHVNVSTFLVVILTVITSSIERAEEITMSGPKEERTSFHNNHRIELFFKNGDDLKSTMLSKNRSHDSSFTQTECNTLTPKIKAVLFDLDGTLLDTESLSDKALIQAFGDSLSHEVRAKAPMASYRLPWELKQQILGLRGAEWAPLVLRYAKEHWDLAEDKSPPTPLELWKNWEDRLNALCHEVESCPGANELVLAFSTMGFQMAIATSSRAAGVEKKRVRHEEIFRHMTAIVAGDDPAIGEGKPAPDIYLEAARRLQVHPGECLVFEDALSGVRSGKAAGCVVCAIPDLRFTEAERSIFLQEADLVIDSLWSFDGKAFGIQLDMPKSKKLEENS